MAQIFVSHSRDDIRLRQWFDEIFAGSPVKAIRFEFEFEAQAENPIPSIVQMIQGSAALFVLLGTNLLYRPTMHTTNWVSAEVGLAKGFNIPIWVFENITSPISFPVPFVDHYVRIRLDMPEYHTVVREWVNAYQPIIRQRDPIRGEAMPCGNPGCKSVLQVHQPWEDMDRCPVCTMLQTWSKTTDQMP